MKIRAEKLIKYIEEVHSVEVVSYGLEILLEEVISVVVIVLIGVFQHCLVESLIFIGCSILGTGTMGTFHCRTRIACLFTNIFLF